MIAGNVIAKQSFPKWYEFHLRLLYHCIKHYQKLKWGKNYDAVHVYIVLPRNNELWLFEQTWPVATWTPISYLHDKTYSVCEWGGDTLDIDCIVKRAEKYIGKKYDLGDLLDFAVSGFIFKIFCRVIRIFGDKAKRLFVCSTMVAHLLKKCGCSTIRTCKSVDPAYFENNSYWNIVSRYKKGKSSNVGD